MQLIRGLYNLNLNSALSGSVVTVGNFDGVHRGHQALLDALEIAKKKYRVPSVAIVFEPQPREFFDSIRVPRIMRFREKFLALQNKNIDYLCCLCFNKSLASWSAEKFVKEILLKQLHMRSMLVGHDFHFGAGRRGDLQLLQRLGDQYGFTAEHIAPVWADTELVSSTRLREALRSGDMDVVYRLLGRHYSVQGRVCQGRQRGRDLGFPTANINLHRSLTPLSGVFVVRVRLGPETFSGVANIGVRPTFNSAVHATSHGTGEQVWLEVHLFDFNRVIYGAQLEVIFLNKLREEKRFADFSDLVQQIRLDVEQAKCYFDTLLE